MFEKNIKVNIWPMGMQKKAFCKIENYLWFIHGYMNALMRCDMETGKTEYIASVEGEKLIGNDLYSQIIQHENNLFLIPRKANRIAVYNTNLCKFNYIEYGEDIDIRCAILVEKNIYLIPTFCNKSIFILNTNSLRLEKKINLLQYEYIKGNVSGTNCCFNANYIYIPTYNYGSGTGCVVRLNCENNDIEIVLKDVEKNGFASIAILNDKMYLSAYCEKIYVVEKESETVLKVFEGLGAETLILGAFEDKILLDSAVSENIYAINSLEILEILFNKNNSLDKKIKRDLIGAYEYYDTYGIYFDRNRYRIYFFNCEGVITRQVKPNMSDKEFGSLLSKWVENVDDIIHENALFTLQGMIEGVVKGNLNY